MKISKLSALIFCCAIAVGLLIGCGSDDDDTSEREIWCDERCELVAPCEDGDVQGCKEACKLAPPNGNLDCFLSCETEVDCQDYYPCQNDCVTSTGFQDTLVWLPPDFEDES